MTTTDAHNEDKGWYGWQEPEQLPPPKGYGDADGLGGHPIRKLRLLKSASEGPTKKLVVVLHGLEFPFDQKVNSECYQNLLRLLLRGEDKKGLADLLLIDYPNDLTVKKSVADALAPAIGAAIEQVHRDYETITLLGHSFGSLLARRALVDAAENNEEWCRKTLGMIVLAGTNLGFKYQKTSLLRVKALNCIATVSDKLAPWLADAIVYFLNWGRLLSYGWRNSEWVTDTRIKWFRLYEGNKTFLKTKQQSETESPHQPQSVSCFKTVYISATEDEFVGSDDLQMVYQLGDFYCEYKIEGARHADFLDKNGKSDTLVAKLLSKKENTDSLNKVKGDIRCVLEGSQPDGNSSFDRVKRVSELHRHDEVDQGSKRTVVFLIHGIRDNAEWQEDIDYNLRDLHKAIPLLPKDAVIHISQVRYGYFNALQFLFPSERKRAVRAFSDEYLRVLARFSDLPQENIHVYAHSNGTFVFGQALKKYSEIKVGRVLLGGSVLPPSFPWRKFVNCRQSSCSTSNNNICNRQVMQLLNYAANADWPTGFLCRGLSYLPGLDGPLLGVGPGGTDGFKDLRNFSHSGAKGMIGGWNFFLEGGHGATLQPEAGAPQKIAEYLLGYRKDGGLPAYSPEELDAGLDPFQQDPQKPSETPSKTSSYRSPFRGLIGNTLSAVALVAFFEILLFLLGLPSVVYHLLSLVPGFTDLAACFAALLQALVKPLVTWMNIDFSSINLKVAATMLLAYLLSRF
jgi:pimeloyl-ACP methyl ester carboxylesterase